MTSCMGFFLAAFTVHVGSVEQVSFFQLIVFDLRSTTLLFWFTRCFKQQKGAVTIALINPL